MAAIDQIVKVFRDFEGPFSARFRKDSNNYVAPEHHIAGDDGAPVIGASSDTAWDGSVSSPSLISILKAVASKLLGTVAVSGPLTDAELRASAVPVSLASVPLASGAASSAKQDAILTTLAAVATAAKQDALLSSNHNDLAAIFNALVGTLTVSAQTLPLPSGAATSAKQDVIVTALGSLATSAKQDALATANHADLVAILGRLSTDPATQTTLAEILAVLSGITGLLDAGATAVSATLASQNSATDWFSPPIVGRNFFINLVPHATQGFAGTLVLEVQFSGDANIYVLDSGTGSQLGKLSGPFASGINPSFAWNCTKAVTAFRLRCSSYMSGSIGAKLTQ